MTSQWRKEEQGLVWVVPIGSVSSKRLRWLGQGSDQKTIHWGGPPPGTVEAGVVASVEIVNLLCADSSNLDPDLACRDSLRWWSMFPFLVGVKMSYAVMIQACDMSSCPLLSNVQESHSWPRVKTLLDGYQCWPQWSLWVSLLPWRRVHLSEYSFPSVCGGYGP
jgi:hypothetical protein